MGRKSEYAAIRAFLRYKPAGTAERPEIPLAPEALAAYRLHEQIKAERAQQVESESLQQKASVRQQERAGGQTQKDQWLDYCLGVLDGEERRAFALGMQQDPESIELLIRLQERISLLLDDGIDPLPPPGLTVRTMQLVERHRWMEQERNSPRWVRWFVPTLIRRFWWQLRRS